MSRTPCGGGTRCGRIHGTSSRPLGGINSGPCGRTRRGFHCWTRRAVVQPGKLVAITSIVPIAVTVADRGKVVSARKITVATTTTDGALVVCARVYPIATNSTHTRIRIVTRVRPRAGVIPDRHRIKVPAGRFTPA